MHPTHQRPQLDLRCIETTDSCHYHHPGHAVTPEQMQHLMTRIYDGTQVRLATNAWGRPDQPRSALREVRMSAFIDPQADTWRWALEIWGHGQKTTHDYPYPPTDTFNHAAIQMDL